jgi:hypothetical protein
VKENIKDGVYNSQKLNLYSPPQDRSILQSTTRQATAAATFGCLRSTANRVKTIDNNNKSQKQNDTWQTHVRSAASGGGPRGHSTSFKGQLQAVEAVYGRLRRANEWLHGKFGRKVDCAHGDQKLKVHADCHQGHTRSARSWEEHHKDLHSAKRSHGGEIIKPPKSQDPRSGYGCVPSQDQVDQVHPHCCYWSLSVSICAYSKHFETSVFFCTEPFLVTMRKFIKQQSTKDLKCFLIKIVPTECTPGFGWKNWSDGESGHRKRSSRTAAAEKNQGITQEYKTWESCMEEL